MKPFLSNENWIKEVILKLASARIFLWALSGAVFNFFKKPIKLKFGC